MITADIESFATGYTKIVYKKGEIILRASDAPQGVYFLKKGYVRQYAVSKTGAVLMVHIYRPGAFFPMTWVINNTPNTYYFEAMTNAEIYRAPKEDTLAFLRDNPPILMHVMSRMLLGLSGLVKRMEYLVSDDAYTKTVLLLVHFAKTLGEKKGKQVKLPISIPHREIAAWIGTTRETASLQVEALEKKGLIQYQKRIMIIPDLEALSKQI